MGSLNETRITRKMRKSTRKEPRSAAHFEQMYQMLKERNRLLKNKAQLKFNHQEAMKHARKIIQMIGSRDGQGIHIICPLKSGLHQAEFLKGFFKYTAPKARVSALVTPSADAIGYEADTKVGFRIVGKMSEKGVHALIKTTRNHLEKCVTPNDTRLIFFDDHAFGRTAWLIDKAINKSKKLKDKEVYYPNSYYLGQFIAGTYVGKENGAIHSWLEHGHKARDGTLWADAVNFMRSNSPDKKHKNQNTEINRRATQKLFFDRRFSYNLGIAVAREYLRSQAQK